MSNKTTNIHIFNINDNYNYKRAKEITRSIITHPEFKPLVIGEKKSKGEGVGVVNKGESNEVIYVNGLGENKGKSIKFSMLGASSSVDTGNKNYDVVIAAIVSLLKADGMVREASSTLTPEDEYSPLLLMNSEQQREAIQTVANNLNIDIYAPSLRSTKNTNVDEDVKADEEDNSIESDSVNKEINDESLISVKGNLIVSRDSIVIDILNARGVPDESFDNEKDKILKEPEERICLIYEKYYKAEAIYDLINDEFKISEDGFDPENSISL